MRRTRGFVRATRSHATWYRSRGTAAAMISMAGGECSRGQGDGDAARQQAHRADDRQVEYLFRGRAGHALAEIEEVGDDEDGEERRLGDDESDHAGAPTRSSAIHAVRPGRRDAAGPTTAAGSLLQARSRSCTRAAERSWPIRASRPPTGCSRLARRGAMSTRR